MNPIVKGSAKSKTVWLAIAVIVLGNLQANAEALAPVIPQKWLGVANIVVGTLLLVARFFTTQSLADKGQAVE